MRRVLWLALAAACGDDGAARPDAQIVWDTCTDEPRATAASLAEKAAVYDARLIALHTAPALPWVLDVHVEGDQVIAWRSSENDGLWTGLALASQAYRYAVTRDPAARDAIATLLEGERLRMAITGVPGLFTRQLIPPGVAGIACPDDAALYVPSPDKRGNRWVRVGDDGCAQVADADTLAFSSTTHCGLDEFAGWCFLDNVSQDEYVGHIVGLGAVATRVDDPALRDAAAEMLHQIGDHLVDNGMEFVDWDGRPTQWGKIHPGAEGDTPGYLAVMGIAFLSTIAEATDEPALDAARDEIAATYPTYFDEIFLWEGVDGCLSNWNNISMLAANFHQAIANEPDDARRAVLQATMERELMRPDHARAALAQKNAWFDILWAAQNGAPDPAAVRDAACQLRQFPASNQVVARDTAALAPHACEGRSGESLAATPFDVADRCAATFVWWQNPYERRSCADEPYLVDQPAGYLLPYWMARYYGFLDADD